MNTIATFLAVSLVASTIIATDSAPPQKAVPAACATASNATPAAAAAPAGMVEVKIELPPRMFQGTPTNMKGVRLDPAAAKKQKRDPFLAPAGTKNLSLKNPVTASDSEPVIGELELVTDGIKDGKEGCYVEFGPSTQWIQIDLENPATIHGIVLWHYHSMARVYRDIVVQLADDPDFIENVRTVFNSDDDNSSKLGKGTDFEYIETSEGFLIPVKAEKARYIRLYSNGSTAGDQNHYTEVEVYGVEGK